MFWKRLVLPPADAAEAGLATWRVAHILVYEAGPFDAFIKLREALGIKHDEFGNPIGWPHGVVLACLWCTSVWVAAAMLVLPKPIRQAFALSAVACIVERADGSSEHSN